jgi:nucleoside-diphosphate-sugar epimerase
MLKDVKALRVVVTGGSGKIGRAAMAALKTAGHRPVNFDAISSPDGSRSVIADLADFGQTLGALSGVDTMGGVPEAVVHLAGIPSPGRAPDHHIFQNNLMSTYNVFSACKRLGIKRIVWASSETILGLPFAEPPAFAPLDETHPDRPEWSYSLSKHLGEVMADQFVRWSPDTSITSLRFSNVFESHEYGQLAAIQARPEMRKGNLWGYVDARDCGEACRLAVEAALPGHEALIIAAADSAVDTPSAELIARFYPGTPIKGELVGCQSLLSSAKAEKLIGYKPRYSWRDAKPS